MFASKAVGLIFIGTLIASLASPCHGHRYRNNRCPNEWFTAQFESLADAVAPAIADTDKDLTFFRDIMLFSEKKIERVTQDAIEFFNTKFGLDFSQSPPNDLGQRTFANAVLQPFVLSPKVRYTVNVNSWLLFGRTRNFCFENRDGGFGVSFTGKQMLHGTYGGEDGIPANPGEQVVYGFYNIPVFPKRPIIIQYQSNTPFRFEPIDGFGVINCELHHRTLGAGAAQGVFRVTPTEEPGMFHFSIRNTFTFPAHPGLI